MPRNKYGAKRTTIDGINFASKKEAARYQDLKYLLMAGEISDLKCHPRFLIIEAQDHHGKHLKPAHYTADFQYIENGKTIVEEVKSSATETTAFVLRMKLFIQMYGDEIELRVVK